MKQTGSRRARQARWAATALGLVAAALLAACGSGSAPASPSASTVSATCAQLAAVLSDGPDPSADPVGYAEAQIAPLRAIKTADPALRAEIGNLASAYAKVFTTNGNSASAARAAAAASKKVNAICPGAAS